MKTMKSFLFALVAVLGLSFSASAQGKYVADASKSSLQWLGKKVAGEHSGGLSLGSGSFEIKGSKLVGGKFEIDMNSITVTDIKEADMAQKLVGHLKSDDFFGVAKFPKATFVIKSSEVISTKSITVKGQLTIKNVTQPIEFKALFKKTAEGYNIYANIIVDRSKFGVRYGSGSFFDDMGDKMIYDEFELKLNLVATLAK
jgi:polyisoprenoid-binding protein YceI